MPKRDLVSITDLTKDEINYIFKKSLELKAGVKHGEFTNVFHKKCLAMIFMKPSLRTRCTFEIGMVQLGGHAVYLAPSDIGMGKRESIKDVARNLERWFDIIMARVFKHETIADMAKYASIPVINALCDAEHPCQVMADFMAVLEHRSSLDGFKLAFIGDGNNVCHSLILLSAILGTEIHVSTPRGYEPGEDVVAKAWEIMKTSGGSYSHYYDPVEAVKNVEAIYTDVWASMGQEHEAGKRFKIFQPYQVNTELVSKAPKDVMIMHDLPAHRGEEITDDVIDSDNAIVYDQAENRLHAQKGIMVFLAEQSGQI